MRASAAASNAQSRHANTAEIMIEDSAFLNLIPPPIPEWRQQCDNPFPAPPIPPSPPPPPSPPLLPPSPPQLPNTSFPRYARFSQLAAQISVIAKAANKHKSGYGFELETISSHTEATSLREAEPLSPNRSNGSRFISSFPRDQIAFDVVLSPAAPTCEREYTRPLSKGAPGPERPIVQFVVKGLSEAIGLNALRCLCGLVVVMVESVALFVWVPGCDLFFSAQAKADVTIALDNKVQCGVCARKFQRVRETECFRGFRA
jgi:hypothetical protein